MKKHTQNFEKLTQCVDATINGWSKADMLTEIEQRAEAQNIIYGIVRAALYVLNTDEYFDFTTYVHGKGFNH